jgi:hypothetical protein
MDNENYSLDAKLTLALSGKNLHTLFLKLCKNYTHEYKDVVKSPT